MRCRTRTLLFGLVASAAALLAPGAHAADAKRLKVGITLHPYYSFVAKIVGDRADVVPLIDADANPHGYAPQSADMIRIMSMDVLVVNGIGHDTWAFEILDAAGLRDTLPLIYANDGVSLIPVAGDPSGAKVVNPHTFISTTAAIQQVYTIARKLGEIDSANATYFRDNSRRYALEIRKLRSEFDAKIAGADQAIYNALYTVKDEIPAIYDDINAFNVPGEKFHWPNLEHFQEWLLPPFYKDTSWEQNGSLAWTLFEPLAEGEMQGSTMYLGTDGTLPGQGSFLLIIGHVHAGFTNNNAIVIWWNEKNHVEMPTSGFRDGLILQGWKEAVPYSGAQEVRRIFGDDAPAAFPELPDGIGTTPAVPESEGEDVESIIEGALEN